MPITQPEVAVLFKRIGEVDSLGTEKTSEKAVLHRYRVRWDIFGLFFILKTDITWMWRKGPKTKPESPWIFSSSFGQPGLTLKSKFMKKSVFSTITWQRWQIQKKCTGSKEQRTFLLLFLSLPTYFSEKSKNPHFSGNLVQLLVQSKLNSEERGLTRNKSRNRLPIATRILSIGWPE